MSLSEPTRHTLIARLNEVLSQESLLSDAETMRPYECDGLSAYRQLPAVVCLPETVDQVQAVMRISH
jgi:glycolate oxidase